MTCFNGRHSNVRQIHRGVQWNLRTCPISLRRIEVRAAQIRSFLYCASSVQLCMLGEAVLAEERAPPGPAHARCGAHTAH